MLELPKECYVNKFIPKKVFYEKLGIASSVKDEFINIVDKITWLYKLSEDTLSITKTDEVEEIQIFQIDLKERKMPLSVIKSITKGIKYKILFLIKYENEYCYAIKVDDIYSTQWNEKITFDFNQINLEILYQSIVKSIIKENDNNKSFDKIIEERNKRIDLLKRINQLKQKIKAEKQFNRKTELNIELNKLLNEMENLNNE